MGEVGIFEQEQTRWIQYDKDTEILLKHLDRQELRTLKRKAEKAASTGGVDAVEFLNIRIGRASVKNWRHIRNHEHPGLTINGQPLPFNQDNLDMLMSRSLDFSNFVNENAIDAKAFLQEESEKKD